MKKPVIAHVCGSSYLPITQTFIYRYLLAFDKIRPIVLASSIKNRQHFPLKHKVYACSNKQYSNSWLINSIAEKIMGDNDYYRNLVLKFTGTKLIHAHFGPTGYHLLRHKKRLGLPMVTTFYGYDMAILPKYEIWRNRYQKLFSEGDLFLVEGGNMKKMLIAIGCPEKKILIQHIAIDMDLFPFKEKRPRFDAKVKLFFCGRLIEKKGVIYALKALKATLPNFPNMSFNIIGDGDLRVELEQYVADNDLSEIVKFLGVQSHQVVAAEMANADIFIHPSVTASNGDSEGGAPTILLEAQSAGLPILASTHADIPEVVLDGESGLLSPERDWKMLGINLLYLLENQHQWKVFGKAGRNHIAAQYDIQHEVGKLENIYFQLLGFKGV